METNAYKLRNTRFLDEFNQRKKAPPHYQANKMQCQNKKLVMYGFKVNLFPREKIFII